MTKEELLKKIDAIYEDTIKKLKEIEHEQDIILSEFMLKLKKEKTKLDSEKIDKIREQLLSKDGF